MTDSTFSKMASMITIRDVQTPLGPDVKADMGGTDFEEYLMEASMDQGYDYVDRISLVREKKKPIGWCGFDSFVKDEDDEIVQKHRVRDVMDPIRPDSLMAAGTSYFSAVEVFNRSSELYFFFVLENNDITGTLHYNNLFGLPGRACIFTLTLELEEVGLELCQINSEESWNLLNGNRRSKIASIYMKKHPSFKLETPPYSNLLEQTMFVDKGTILSKSKFFTKETRQLAKRTFSKADDTRNACAHTGGESRLPSMLGRNRFPTFIKECNDLIALMRQALINNG